VSRETLLILDRKFNTAWTLSTFLIAQGYVALVVDSYDRALNDFSEFEISGVISEYRAGDFSAVELIRKLKTDSPELYVMVLADSVLDEEEYETVMEAGVDDFFLKPFSVKKILIHLRKGLEHRRVVIDIGQLKMRLQGLQIGNPG